MSYPFTLGYFSGWWLYLEVFILVCNNQVMSIHYLMSTGLCRTQLLDKQIVTQTLWCRFCIYGYRIVISYKKTALANQVCVFTHTPNHHPLSSMENANVWIQLPLDVQVPVRHPMQKYRRRRKIYHFWPPDGQTLLPGTMGRTDLFPAGMSLTAGRQQPACYLGGEVKCPRRHKSKVPLDRSSSFSRECSEIGPANNAAKENTPTKCFPWLLLKYKPAKLFIPPWVLFPNHTVCDGIQIGFPTGQPLPIPTHEKADSLRHQFPPFQL